MSKHSAKHVEQARISLAIIKWLAIIALLFLPFSFSDGIADWRYLAVASVAGVLWIFALIYSWRHETPIAGGIAFLIAIGAYHLSDSFYASEPPFGIFLQWLAAFLAVAAIPVVVFRVRLLEYCGLNETKAQQGVGGQPATRRESKIEP